MRLKISASVPPPPGSQLGQAVENVTIELTPESVTTLIDAVKASIQADLVRHDSTRCRQDGGRGCIYLSDRCPVCPDAT